MTAESWTTSDEGYLRAYRWAGSLAAGAALPTAAVALGLGPGEIAHAQVAPVGVSGLFGENVPYRRSFLLVGGPVGLALTGAASLARNQTKKAEAERAAVPRWHGLGSADVVMTNQRLVVTNRGKVESFWHAESSPLVPAAGAAGVPAVRFRPSGLPLLQLESPWALLLFVFVHHLLDGRPPAVPLPPDLLARAGAQGRLA